MLYKINTLNQNIKSFKLDTIVNSLNELNNIIDKTKILNNKFLRSRKYNSIII